MSKQELIAKNPIRQLNFGVESASGSRMGLVMARAGLGKTAMLVQIALDSLLNGRQVVHVGIGQSLEKTRIWYDDIFKDIVAGCKICNPYAIYDEIMRNRMIMTFKATAFTRSRLEERLNDLVYQNVIRPGCIVVDGYDFTVVAPETLSDLRELAQVMDVQIWFSAISHRGDERTSPEGVPAPCHEVADFFDTVVLLQPDVESAWVDLKIIKDNTGGASDRLQLDPITFMVKEGL
ncbi:MAG: hypothetical protein EYX74_05830 [Desulfobulbaceae bacterium]|nr:MAG: hypothetical protein EYX74_05830 [Desulfobulbaceae bacterium]